MDGELLNHRGVNVRGKRGVYLRYAKRNPENVEKYKYLYEHAYMKMYPNLKGIYRDIKKFDDKNLK